MTAWDLTVIVPYYKLRFLDAALASLSAQTVGSFSTLVCDDCSPEDPSEIIRKYQSRLNLRYLRFSENLGGSSLAAQWNRCVRLCETPWVWLFSDDDIVAPDCIEGFVRTLAQTAASFDVYRFENTVIDESGVRYEPPPPPPWRPATELGLARFEDRPCSFAIEYIFRRAAFDRQGGFVEFPLAWFSDDASWMSFARVTGIWLIQGGRVYWRRSVMNLSAADPRNAGLKLRAFKLYLLWWQREFPDKKLQHKIRMKAADWLPRQLEEWGGVATRWEGVLFWLFFARFTRQPCLSLFLKCLQLKPI